MHHTVTPDANHLTLGIDIAKATLDVSLHPNATARQFTNDPKGHAALIAWIAPRQPARIVFEPTGAYHRALETALAKASLPAVKLNPLQTRRFAEATGQRVKTDPVDAARLARFGATLQPELIPARDQTLDQLNELLAARRAPPAALRPSASQSDRQRRWSKTGPPP